MNRNAKRQAFLAAVKGGDPYTIASAISMPPISKTRKPEPQLENRSESALIKGIEWSPVLTFWLNACEFAEAGYAVKCYESQSALHTSFNQLFASSPGNLLVPALLSVCKSTHRIAVAADHEIVTNSREHASLQKAASLLQESFSRTLNDRKEFRPEDPLHQEGSKKLAVLSIVNELFGIYFRLNTLRLCKNLQKPVEMKKLDKQGSMGQLVTYRYYVGRLNLFEDQYAEAEANLEYALVHCHRQAVHNKKCILRYLIPVKLYRGRLPSSQMLSEFELHEFVPIVEGVRKGDLRVFNKALVDFQHRFIRQGTYLLLEKCKTICYRNLFKRIQLVMGKNQISLTHVAHAFKWMGMPIDLDEVECILANLIYRGYVRGYLSHTKRVLVLSKRDPFPISAVMQE